MGDFESPMILASASPRRRELLASLGLTFEVVPSDADETLEPIALPEAVAALALRKARAVAAARRAGLIVAAATIVVIDGRALGKPADRAGAGGLTARRETAYRSSSGGGTRAVAGRTT